MGFSLWNGFGACFATYFRDVPEVFYFIGFGVINVILPAGINGLG